MALTKSDIVDTLFNQTGFPRARCMELVEALLEIIKGELSAGNDVLISNFGKFCVREKRDRKGRNPATGEEIMLGARRVVTFKCSGRLRERVNENV